MTISYVSQDGGQIRLYAASADTLPTTNMNNGDRAIINDGADKIFIDGSWVDDTTDLSDATGPTTPVTIADGANVTQGALADAVVAAGASGSISAKLRRLTTDLAALLGLGTASTGTAATVASSATSVTLQAANSARKGWAVFNESSQVLYLKFGATASATSYYVQVPAGGFYEMSSNAIYTGIIDGIWASTNGNARVTELT